jgi:hypothetical protein
MECLAAALCRFSALPGEHNALQQANGLHRILQLCAGVRQKNEELFLVGLKGSSLVVHTHLACAVTGLCAGSAVQQQGISLQLDMPHVDEETVAGVGALLKVNKPIAAYGSAALWGKAGSAPIG